MPAQLSVPGRRLLLRLKQPLHSAISVLATNLDPDGPQEAYFDPSGQHHPIGNEPVTEPPVASLTVTEEYMSDWQNEWYTINMEGFDDDEQPAPEDMPPTFEPLVVTASNGRFVSIQDYVEAVYPWLMQRREQILRARHVAEEHYEPGADGDEEALLMALDDAELVRAEDEREWLATLRRIFEARSQQN